MPFLTTPLLGTVGRNGWVLASPLVFVRPGVRIVVPDVMTCPEFASDLASIPAVFQMIFPVVDHHRFPAILHDWLYFKRGVIGAKTFTRSECDDLFLQAMTDSGVSRWKRYSIWMAVRMGGFFSWGDK